MRRAWWFFTSGAVIYQIVNIVLENGMNVKLASCIFSWTIPVCRPHHSLMGEGEKAILCLQRVLSQPTGRDCWFYYILQHRKVPLNDIEGPFGIHWLNILDYQLNIPSSHWRDVSTTKLMFYSPASFPFNLHTVEFLEFLGIETLSHSGETVTSPVRQMVQKLWLYFGYAFLRYSARIASV